MNTKKVLTAGFLSLCLLGGASILRAKEWSKEDMQKKTEEKVQKMTKDLNLTSDQQATVRAALQDKMNRMEEVQVDTHNKIKAALTPEQAQKFENMDTKKNMKTKERKDKEKKTY